MFLLLIILLAGGAFFLWFIGNKSLQTKSPSQPGIPVYLQNQGDSDGDNLADWEELLWGSDPDNPDSDGDETKDGVEVLVNRNPNKPGPDDQLVAPEEKATITLDQALKKRTEPLLTPDREELTKRQSSYQASDLNLVATNQTNLVAYASVFVNFLQETRSFPADNAVRLALDYDETKDPAIITKLIKMSNFFQQQALTLKAVAVPEGALEAHLDLINSLQDLATNIGHIALIPTEPVLALQSTQVYTTKVLAMVGAVRKLGDYLAKQNIDLDQYQQ